MTTLVQYITGTLNETRALLLSAMAQFTERGLTVDYLEERAHDLEQTSHHFVLQTVPWYRRPLTGATRWIRNHLPDYIPFYYCCCRRDD